MSRGKSRAPVILVAIVGLAAIGAFVASQYGNNENEVGSNLDPVSMPASEDATAARAARSYRTTSDNSADLGRASGEQRQERNKKMEEARNDLAMRFSQEQADSRWSAKKESTLQALADSPTYTQAGVTPADLQIDCRATICKVTATHASYAAAADWAMLYMTSSAGELPKSFTNTITNADGTARVEIYAQGR